MPLTVWDYVNLNLTTTCPGGKWAVIWPPNFATKYVSFTTNLLGSKYLLPAHTCDRSDKSDQ